MSADDPSVVVRQWAAKQARPFPLDGPNVLSLLPEATVEAAVVGVAASVRSAHELARAGHAVLESLTTHAGARAASIEGTNATGQALDTYITEGVGEPEALVQSSQGFLRTRETLALVRWLRAFNVEHPEDPIRVVHDLGAPLPATGRPEQLERALAERLLRWHEATGARIVHLGGTAHTIVGDPCVVCPYSTRAHRNAGAYLREKLGRRYQALALTTGAGEAIFPVPAPPAAFTEAVFTETPTPTALLDLTADPLPPADVVAWLATPLRTRCAGPAYDPARDGDHHVTAGPLTDAVDALLHAAEITSVTPLVQADTRNWSGATHRIMR